MLSCSKLHAICSYNLNSEILCPNYNFLIQIEVVPVKRISSVLEMKPLDFKDMGPCGGFSTQYACYCDYYNMPYR